ncbi:peptidoglycan-binding domain-containing protein [Enhygromyxa salina]|uniref:Putative peptidoglycan binding domain protein n=1 Tax=Enhygromyxa salina TaxID=215803 RepID=A0A2S9YMT7_9BACT|nr:peptidoglycan-binding domain-containing protein [Enhygromyxa salina]PRQ06407.1 putative peptidoglycan binding domain protein [Enhygromyxa salina]
MGHYHTVKAGECISSIAYASGFFPEQVWQAPENEPLRTDRGNPNLLVPGDALFIPDKARREESVPVDQRSRFVLRGVPAKLHLEIRDDGQAVAGAPYTVTVDGEPHTGVTDDAGAIDLSISPTARRASVEVYLADGDVIAYPLELGQLRPITELDGVRARLDNLGFDCRGERGPLGAKTRAALERFQATHELDVSGEPDAATTAKLEAEHGS